MNSKNIMSFVVLTIGTLVSFSTRLEGARNNSKLDKTFNDDLDRRQFIINLNNYVTSTTSAKAEQVDNSQEVNIPSWGYSKLHELFNQESMYNTFKDCKQSLTSYKKTLIVSIVALCYGYVAYRLRVLHNRLADHNAWINWKIVIPLHQLRAQSNQDLCEQLVFDIYKKYALRAPRCETGVYYQYFLDDIKFEIASVQEYQSILKLINICYLKRLFPAYEHIEMLAEKHERLMFVYDLCMMHFREQKA